MSPRHARILCWVCGLVSLLGVTGCENAFKTGVRVGIADTVATVIRGTLTSAVGQSLSIVADYFAQQ